MKKLLFVFFFLLSSLLLSFVFYYKSSDSSLTIQMKDKISLLIIPLDNRPVNTYIPQKISKNMNVDVVMPPENLLGSLTDGADLEKLKNWTLKNATNVDGFVISIDMLVYGGLVSSRTSLLTQKEAEKNLYFINELKEMFPNKKIYAYDSILRLSPTAIDKYALDDYKNIRKWAILYDKVHYLNEEHLNNELVVLENDTSPDLLDSYQKRRTRNFSINEKALALVKDNVIDFLILAQDDASKYGLHRHDISRLNEIIKRDNLSDTVHVLAGIDEIGSLIMVRLVNDFIGFKPTFYIHHNTPFNYFWTPPFETDNLHQEVKKHISAIGGKTITFPFQANIQFYVNGDGFFDFVDDIFVQSIQANLNKNRYVFVSDVAVVNKSDKHFVESLLKIHPHELSAYSGWNTASNAIGLTLSKGISHVVASETNTDSYASLKHHFELLYHSFLVDYGYKTVIFPNQKQYANDLNVDYLDLNEHTLTFEKDANEQFRPLAQYIKKTLFHESPFIVEETQKPSITFPWERLFEVSVEPALTFTQQKSLFKK